MEGSDYPIPRVFCGAKTRVGGRCKHGRYTREAIAERRQLNSLLREVTALLREV